MFPPPTDLHTFLAYDSVTWEGCRLLLRSRLNETRGFHHTAFDKASTQHIVMVRPWKAGNYLKYR